MKKLKVTRKHLLIATLVLGVLFIVLGALNAYFNFLSNPDLERNIYYGFIIVVVLIFTWSRRLRSEEESGNEIEDKNAKND